MELKILFWILAGIAGLQLWAIFAVGKMLNALLKSKMARLKAANTDQATKIILALVFLQFPTWAEAAIPFPELPEIEYTRVLVDKVAFLNLALLLILTGLLYVLGRMHQFEHYRKEAKSEAKVKANRLKARKKIMHILTDAVPLDQEETVETDHEYDGIRELDNNLPPWWKWGFYVSIVFAGIYLMHFHVLNNGDLSAAAYEKQIAEAAVEVEDYLKSQKMNVDEHNVELLTEKVALMTGASLFDQYCKVCHGANGEGLVGPNLTDPYWIHGGDIQAIFTTVKYGAERGMKSWKDELNPIQMQQVSSYIKSLEGTNPANAKGPEGELYAEAELTANE